MKDSLLNLERAARELGSSCRILVDNWCCEDLPEGYQLERESKLHGRKQFTKFAGNAIITITCYR